MTIFLILGLFLLAASVIVVVRGFAAPGATGETLQQIIEQPGCRSPLRPVIWHKAQTKSPKVAQTTHFSTATGMDVTIAWPESDSNTDR